MLDDSPAYASFHNTIFHQYIFYLFLPHLITIYFSSISKNIQLIIYQDQVINIYI